MGLSGFLSPVPALCFLFMVENSISNNQNQISQAWDEASSLNADQSCVFTIGSSAGGSLALSVADALIAKGNASHIRGIVAIVPVTAHPSSIPDAYKQHYTAYEENKSGVPILDAESMNTFFEAVGVDFKDPGTCKCFSLFFCFYYGGCMDAD
jgi:acetyl esterase/lipase